MDNLCAATATFSVAKQRLPDTLRDHRSKIESLTAFAEGKMTVGNATDVYLQKVRACISLKPRSKDYRELMIDFIRRSWPSLFETDVRKVSPRDCELWLSRYQQRYSPSVINNSIGTLRAIFDQSPPSLRDDLYRERCGHSYCFALARAQRRRRVVYENVRTFAPRPQLRAGPASQFRYRSLTFRVVALTVPNSQQFRPSNEGGAGDAVPRCLRTCLRDILREVSKSRSGIFFLSQKCLAV